MDGLERAGWNERVKWEEGGGKRIREEIQEQITTSKGYLRSSMET